MAWHLFQETTPIARALGVPPNTIAIPAPERAADQWKNQERCLSLHSQRVNAFRGLLTADAVAEPADSGRAIRGRWISDPRQQAF